MKRLSLTGTPSSTQQLPRLAIAAGLASLCASAAFGLTASGTVKTSAGAAIQGVIVTVNDSASIKPDTTDAAGAFAFGSTGISFSATPTGFSIRVEGHELVIRTGSEGSLDLALLDASGAQLWKQSSFSNQGESRIALPSGLRSGAAFLRIRHAGGMFYQGVVVDGSDWKVASHLAATRSLAGNAVLSFSKSGYADTAYTMTAATQAGIAVVMRPDTGNGDFVEDHRSECTIPALPAVSALTAIANLPDPFKMMDGTPVTTKAQWKCRREEIAAMLEKYVHGEKPRHPEKVEGSMSGKTLTVKVTDKGKSVSFTVTISTPATGAGPFPAVIGWDGGSINGFSSLPVATISYPISTLGAEGSGRGKGVFYDLYGSNAAASELMAHAWGLSRIIDALLVTPAAKIDAHHLAVTGCSRWGKSSAVSGSFDQRVQLVIPQESGSGGVAAWRIIPSFTAAQPIKSTYDEQFWTRQDFWQNFGSSITKLPVDHHEMVGMIAPRGLLVLDNSIDWLGPEVGWGSANAAKEIYKALGAEEGITYSSVGSHTHCSQPASQDHWVKSYVQKYLLGGTGESAKMEAPSTYKFDRAKWITWTTPTLQ